MSDAIQVEQATVDLTPQQQSLVFQRYAQRHFSPETLSMLETEKFESLQDVVFSLTMNEALLDILTDAIEKEHDHASTES